MAEPTTPTSIYSGKKAWTRRDPGAPSTPQRRWADENRDKRLVHHKVQRAIREGVLKRGKCEVCGSFRVDAHHDSYSEPLNVRWLCRRHHQQWHAALRKVADGSIGADIAALLASVTTRKRKGKKAA